MSRSIYHNSHAQLDTRLQSSNCYAPWALSETASTYLFDEFLPEVLASQLTSDVQQNRVMLTWYCCLAILGCYSKPSPEAVQPWDVSPD